VTAAVKCAATGVASAAAAVSIAGKKALSKAVDAENGIGHSGSRGDRALKLLLLVL
jgi:hypothetical protein